MPNTLYHPRAHHATSGEIKSAGIKSQIKPEIKLDLEDWQGNIKKKKKYILLQKVLSWTC